MNVYVDLDGNDIVNANKIKLLTIAIESFSLKGFSDVSIRDITQEAGIKGSSFYNHFRSKDELQETIFANFRISVGQIMPPVERIDWIVDQMEPEAFMRRGLQNFMEHIQSPKMEEIWRILYLEQCRNEMARTIYLHDVIYRIIDFMEIVFTKYIERKRIRPMSARMLAAEYQYPLFGMLNELLLLRLDGQSTKDIEKQMEDHIIFFSQIIDAKGNMA